MKNIEYLPIIQTDRLALRQGNRTDLGSFAHLNANLKVMEYFPFSGHLRSRGIMEWIGMHHDSKDDFNHLKLSEGHPLRCHVLYREWQKNQRAS